MQFWELLFIISCLLVLYNYAGYALIAYVFTRIKGKKVLSPASAAHPSVSFIVAAYNEQEVIAAKIKNTLSLDYPADKIEYIFIADGSNDQTAEIIGNYPELKLMHLPLRSGKTAALNRAVKEAKNDILIISDANTTLNKNALLQITRHYLSHDVGGVAGEKKVIENTGAKDEVGGGEGIYWKYESWLKKIDSAFHSVVGAAGELFSLRRKLYEPVSADVILDDFIISLRVAQKGYRVIYEPDAYATELPSFSLKDERKRKIRIAAGGFQSIVMLKSLLKFWKHPKLTFLYISHRVMRWTTSPVCMLLALLSNLALVLINGHPIYLFCFLMQVLFYVLAILGSLPYRFSQRKLFRLPFYFMFMNISVFQGFLKFIQGQQSAVWEKAARAREPINVK